MRYVLPDNQNHLLIRSFIDNSGMWEWGQGKERRWSRMAETETKYEALYTFGSDQTSCHHSILVLHLAISDYMLKHKLFWTKVCCISFQLFIFMYSALGTPNSTLYILCYREMSRGEECNPKMFLVALNEHNFTIEWVYFTFLWFIILIFEK